MRRNAGAITSEESFMKDNTERNVDNGNKIFLEEQSGFIRIRS
jgi:hypothetical protein